MKQPSGIAPINAFETEIITLCGIDAPEGAQLLGKQSRDNLERLVRATDGEVIVQPVDRDRYGRVVAEGFASAKNPKQPDEERFFNAEQIGVGMACVSIRGINGCSNSQILIQLEQEATKQRRGVWSDARVIK